MIRELTCSSIWVWCDARCLMSQGVVMPRLDIHKHEDIKRSIRRATRKYSLTLTNRRWEIGVIFLQAGVILRQAIRTRVETKIFVFVFSRTFFFAFREKSLRKVAKIFAKIFVFAKGFEKIFVFTKVFAKIFAKIFYLECGSGHLNVFPDPKHWLKTIPGTKLFREIFRENEYFRENENFRKNFRESENFCKTKFREKWANFRLFSVFAKM
jgi:hypothetical protein